MKTPHLLAVGLLALTFYSARPAQAATITVSSPYGDNTPVFMTLGWVGGQNWAIYQRMPDMECTWIRLSDGPYLTSHVTVILSQKADFALIPGEGQTYNVTCPNFGNLTWTVSREQVNGNETWSTSIYAKGGDDILFCSGYSPGGYVYCLGEQGNDFIKSFNPDALLFGHSGNDTLIAVNVAPYTILEGGDNDDCLSAPSPQPPNYICGPGSFDKSTGVKGGGCESLVSTCQ